MDGIQGLKTKKNNSRTEPRPEQTMEEYFNDETDTDNVDY